MKRFSTKCYRSLRFCKFSCQPNTAGDYTLISRRHELIGEVSCFNVQLKWKPEHLGFNSTYKGNKLKAINWSTYNPHSKNNLVPFANFGNCFLEGKHCRKQTNGKSEEFREGAQRSNCMSQAVPVDQRQKSGKLLCTWAEVHRWLAQLRGEVLQRCFNGKKEWIDSFSSSRCEPATFRAVNRFFANDWQPPPVLFVRRSSESPLPAFRLLAVLIFTHRLCRLTRPKLTLSQHISVTRSIFSSSCVLFSPSHQPKASTEQFLFEFRDWLLNMPTPEIGAHWKPRTTKTF